MGDIGGTGAAAGNGYAGGFLPNTPILHPTSLPESTLGQAFNGSLQKV